MIKSNHIQRTINPTQTSKQAMLLISAFQSLKKLTRRFDPSRILKNYIDLSESLNQEFHESLSLHLLCIVLLEILLNPLSQSHKKYPKKLTQALIKSFSNLILTVSTGSQVFFQYNEFILSPLIKRSILHIAENFSDPSYLFYNVVQLSVRIQSTPFKLIHLGVSKLLLNGTVESPFIGGIQLFVSTAAPFLPEYPRKEKTLILDLDETLVHLKGDEIVARPFLDVFLNEMGEIFEVVCFTAASAAHANRAFRTVGSLKKIQFVLHSSHTAENYVKDLDKVGRDLSKVIIIDNLEHSFSKQPENGLLIKSWFGDESDTELFSLIEVLRRAEKEFSDMREALRSLIKN